LGDPAEGELGLEHEVYEVLDPHVFREAGLGAHHGRHAAGDVGESVDAAAPAGVEEEHAERTDGGQSGPQVLEGNSGDAAGVAPVPEGVDHVEGVRCLPLVLSEPPGQGVGGGLATLAPELARASPCLQRPRPMPAPRLAERKFALARDEPIDQAARRLRRRPVQIDGGGDRAAAFRDRAGKLANPMAGGRIDAAGPGIEDRGNDHVGGAGEAAREEVDHVP
jgi:hypothetical protein